MMTNGQVLGWAACAALLLTSLGCDGPSATFRRYETFAAKASDGDFPEAKWRGVDEALAGLYGTPDDPQLPAVEGIEQLMSLGNLQLAAGPVKSDEHGTAYGLYREHCAHCHGVTGDGNGPTAAFLNPYPRDYRRGIFKFKSTPAENRPTHGDLKQIIVNGIPGTAMPSFKLLLDSEVEALTEYVKYLSIRGETERKLIALAVDSDDEKLVDVKDAAKMKEQAAEVLNQVNDVVAGWVSAPTTVPEVTPRPEMSAEELTASVQRGRNLFYGAVANCVKCHGDSALGDGQTDSVDKWTEEFVDPTKINDKNDLAKAERKYEALGMLKLRTIRPRNLRMGIFRGGLRPIDIHLRIRHGIAGSPMPGMNLVTEKSSKALTESDVWDLVNYVQQLPYEPASEPAIAELTDLRERM